VICSCTRSTRSRQDNRATPTSPPNTHPSADHTTQYGGKRASGEVCTEAGSLPLGVHSRVRCSSLARTSGASASSLTTACNTTCHISQLVGSPHTDFLLLDTDTLKGFLGDLAASIVYVPSEVLKTRLQLQGRYNNPHFRSGYNYRGTVDAARTIVRTEGASALFYGYKATLYRDLPFSALQFMFWEQFHAWSRVYKQSRDIGVPLELLTGAAAGGLAGVITCPLDVVKTRLQTQVNTPVDHATRTRDVTPQKRHISTSSPSTHRPQPGAIALETSSVITGLKVIYRTEGIGGWFRGVGPRGVWTFIQSGCMLFLYQRLLHELEIRMPLAKEEP